MDSPIRVLIWGGLLIAGALVLGVVVLLARRLYRKWLHDEPPEAFSLRELEAMRDAGQLSREEFSQLRRSLLGLSGSGGEKGETLSSSPLELDDGNRGAEESSLPREDKEQR